MPDKEPRVSKTRKRETKDKDGEKQSKEKQRKRTNIPFEVDLVRLRPRENPRAPELRLKIIYQGYVDEGKQKVQCKQRRRRKRKRYGKITSVAYLIDDEEVQD